MSLWHQHNKQLKTIESGILPWMTVIYTKSTCNRIPKQKWKLIRSQIYCNFDVSIWWFVLFHSLIREANAIWRSFIGNTVIWLTRLLQSVFVKPHFHTFFFPPGNSMLANYVSFFLFNQSFSLAFQLLCENLLCNFPILQEKKKHSYVHVMNVRFSKK